MAEYLSYFCLFLHVLRRSGRIYECFLSKFAKAVASDDGVHFHGRMNEIHTELASLNKEAKELMSEIMKEWETLNTK